MIEGMGEFGALNWAILVAYIIGNLVLGYFLSIAAEYCGLLQIITEDHIFQFSSNTRHGIANYRGKLYFFDFQYYCTFL